MVFSFKPLLARLTGKPLPRLSPSQQFAIFSLAIMLFSGTVQALILAQQIEAQMAQTAAEIVAQNVRTGIREQLSITDLVQPMTGERYREFDRFLGANVLSKQVARVKIWNQDGMVVYADNPALVGAIFSDNHELREVLDTGNTVVEFASLTKPEQVGEQGFGALLEIYVPLVPRDSAKVLGAYEVYLSYAPIAAAIQRAQANVFASSAIAIAVLWLALYRVFVRASRALERAEAEHKRALHLALLNEIATEAASTLAVEDLLDRAVQAIWRRFGYYNAAILLLDTARGELVPRANAGLPAGIIPPDHRLKVGEGMVGHVAQTGETYLANDVRDDPYFFARPGLETRAELCVPLRREGAVIGVLNVESREKNVFTPDDITALETLADQLVIALTNAQLYEETKRLSITDGLTGLFNRRYFDERLIQELRRARRYQHPLSAMMIDIDNFKTYNDTHGHPQGDQVLRRLAQVLRTNVRETDLLARYGGEEFVLLLPETGRSTAAQAAEKLRGAVAGHCFLHEDTQPGGDLTISLGVATWHEQLADTEILQQADALIRRADDALYRSKQNGRNQVQCAQWNLHDG